MRKREIHGLTGTKIHHVWMGMQQRVKRNPFYSSRKITICKRWKSLLAFYADMGDVPTGKSLDRIDNNKGYSPENCRWATQKEQCRNKKNNILLTYAGQTMCLMDWAITLNLSYHTLLSRYHRNNSVERIFSSSSHLGTNSHNESRGWVSQKHTLKKIV